MSDVREGVLQKSRSVGAGGTDYTFIRVSVSEDREPLFRLVLPKEHRHARQSHLFSRQPVGRLRTVCVGLPRVTQKGHQFWD